MKTLVVTFWVHEDESNEERSLFFCLTRDAMNLLKKSSSLYISFEEDFFAKNQILLEYSKHEFILENIKECMSYDTCDTVLLILSADMGDGFLNHIDGIELNVRVQNSRPGDDDLTCGFIKNPVDGNLYVVIFESDQKLEDFDKAYKFKWLYKWKD